MPDATRRFALLAAATAPLAACASMTPAPVQMALCPPPQARGDLLGDGTPQRRALIPSRYGQMHVRVQGGTDFTHRAVTMLLAPRGATSAYFVPLMAGLSTERLVLAPDLAGCGLSDAPPAREALSTYADTLLELINLTRVARVDVVGVGAGARLAVALARHAGPPTIRSVLLVHTADHPSFEAYTPSRQTLLRAEVALGGPSATWPYDAHGEASATGLPQPMRAWRFADADAVGAVRAETFPQWTSASFETAATDLAARMIRALDA